MAEDITIEEGVAADGFAIVRQVLGSAALAQLGAALSALDAGAGQRDLAARVAEVGALARSGSIRALVEPVLGPQAALVRSIFFNKSVELNWQVAWHQDVTIAVREQASVAGFGPWSVKQGMPHVQPPAALLEHLLTVRLHLDDADEQNGALWVVPGSHLRGRLPAADASAAAAGARLCAVQAGDAMLMRPLILHASRKSVSARPRRVVHLEFAATPLPAPLSWREWMV